MIRIILDTVRRTVIKAENIEQDGDSYIATFRGIRRVIPADKVAYIENHAGAKGQADQEPPKPGLPNARPDAPGPVLSKAFEEAVRNNLAASAAAAQTPPLPEETSEPEESATVTVRLTGGLDAEHLIVCRRSDAESPTVTETMAQSIFEDANIKHSLQGHHVVGVFKEGGSVVLETKAKGPIRADSTAYATALEQIGSIAQSIKGMQGPDLRLGGLKPNENDSK